MSPNGRVIAAETVMFVESTWLHGPSACGCILGFSPSEVQTGTWIRWLGGDDQVGHTKPKSTDFLQEIVSSASRVHSRRVERGKRLSPSLYAGHDPFSTLLSMRYNVSAKGQ